ncbi:hypothetical protein BD780_004263 [Clostridium tetanomorphum]|uniref:DUF4097 family beta strand repeat-containing protein n=2 Tax=Clostridium tetanomorphum TaxID=1553 RepID=UPI0004538D24|nr:DUF4097 family beta strand repeat-containing protein [Clostridium tetanomorphum]KAJ51981.1 hypothetical protein CTM_09421 [Clostridium tetanomorphum DSM 665]MBP1862901.1 hypothetical protein [Clostridium tetanomorphum]NRS87038.1 hypothetical protein [Clostridium tetanomorphum]
MRQWKVGSLTLGLTLVLIGIMFMIGNIIDMSLLGNLIRFWPIILILLGIEILCSGYMSQKNNEKLKLSGTSIFMFFVLFSICGVLFISSNVIDFTKDGIKFRNPESWHYKYQSSFSKNYTIDPKNHNKAIINTKSGNIFIDKSSSKNIEITANSEIFSNDESKAKKLSESLVKISEKNAIEISANNKSDSFNGNSMRVNLDLHIKLPEKIYAEVLSSFGNMEVKNLSKGLKVTNKNGSILVENISGNLLIENSFGKTSIDNINGNVTAQSKNGDLEVVNITGSLDVKNSFGKTSINNISGNVTTQSKNGDLEVVKVNGSLNGKNSFGLIDASNISGKIDIANNNGDTKLESSKTVNKDITLTSKYGNVNLSLPKEQTGHFILDTKFGKISSDLDLPINKSENNEKESIDKIIGNNNIPIKIYNDNGSISINSR